MEKQVQWEVVFKKKYPYLYLCLLDSFLTFRAKNMMKPTIDPGFTVKHCRMISHSTLALFLIFMISSLTIRAQSWNFIKEKDGIKIYTRTAENSTFKCFKGETTYHATMADLGKFIGNVKNFNWWDKNVKDLNVMEAEPGKHARYYLVYDVPWPFDDRDLSVEVFITYDTVKGIKTVLAKPLPAAVPEKKGIVRIKNYWQKWILTEINPNTVHAVLEGFVDPGGSIPAWLYNMVITETPIKVMSGVRARVEPGQKK
ncbi:MAG: hypothetical protein NTU98_14485 [Bacteroidetes bacterium]|nr:hypothetical protein [Bacteroidota bacterium]